MGNARNYSMYASGMCVASLSDVDFFAAICSRTSCRLSESYENRHHLAVLLLIQIPAYKYLQDRTPTPTPPSPKETSSTYENHHHRRSLRSFAACHVRLQVLGRLQDRYPTPRPKETGHTPHVPPRSHVPLQSPKVQRLCPASKRSSGCAEPHPQLFFHSFIIRRGLSNVLPANAKPARHQQTLRRHREGYP